MTHTFRTGRHWAADAPDQHPGPVEGCAECSEPEEATMPEPYPAELYPGCPCFRCDEPTWREIVPGLRARRMSVCPTCGNKRCPGAADHRNECSGSNEPGQDGSLYA